MKKLLFIFVIAIIILAGLAGGFYWYSQSQPEEILPLQQVALDKPEVDSFDDVCTEKDEYELECKGNIEQFRCDRYRSTGDTLANLNPSYPMVICEKKQALKMKCKETKVSIVKMHQQDMIIQQLM